VILTPNAFHEFRLDAAEEAEEDMIELAFEPQETSRLGCRLVFTPEMDGITVHIPNGANNWMDHIPFDDRSAR